jgi:hypothetical protein
MNKSITLFVAIFIATVFFDNAFAESATRGHLKNPWNTGCGKNMRKHGLCN